MLRIFRWRWQLVFILILSLVAVTLAYQVRVPFSMDIGGQTDRQLLSWVYDPEIDKATGVRYRWTTAGTEIILQDWGAGQPFELELRVRRWQYYERSRSEEFMAFLRQLRRWYPQQYLLVVLDQDTTHPQKCVASRNEMRRLKFHRLSLPKGSPDDNPIETIFSLLQRDVLAGSDAPDLSTLKRRISHYLWQRNRPKNRCVHLAYLDDFHHQ